MYRLLCSVCREEAERVKTPKELQIWLERLVTNFEEAPALRTLDRTTALPDIPLTVSSQMSL